MNTTRMQAIPEEWDEARDIPFFRVTAHLFSPAFCLGAGELLAGNDDDRGTSSAAIEPPAACASSLTVDPVPSLPPR